MLRGVCRIALLGALVAPLLGGCGSLNTVMSSTIADMLPAWAGGLPAGVPPRPGEPGYDDFVRAQHARGLQAEEAVLPAATPEPDPPPARPAVIRPAVEPAARHVTASAGALY